MDIRGWFRLYIEQVMFLIFHIVFPQYFLSIRGFFRALATHRTAGERRGSSFIPLYQFHLLRNIQTIICNFACEHSDTYLQLRSYLLLDEIYHFVKLLFDWLMMCVDFRLFACWFDFRFCNSCLTWETSGLGLASTIILVLQANRLTKCANLPG